MAKPHVFISYCRDNLSEVARLREDLIQAGESVWWDKDGILGGQNWELAIRQAIEHCYAFIVCLSKEATARYQTGIYPELDQAIEIYRAIAPGQVFIIPVRLSACRIPPLKLSATARLDKLQCVDLFPPAQRKAGLQKLLESLQAAPEGHDHRFGHNNQQVPDRGMRDQLRWNKKIDDLNQQWELLNEKLNRLKKQLILETRFEEQFRLEKLIDDTKTQCDQVEEQLKDMERP